MARISPKSPRYRSRQQIAEDITYVLNSPLSHGTQYAVLKEATWVWTEFQGKFKGCHYWSQAAVKQYAANKKQSLLRHEHVVPRKIVMNMLFKAKAPTIEFVRGILDKFLIGVVVTRKEDDKLNSIYRSSMPIEFEDVNSDMYHDPWLRYRECGIAVFFMPLQIEALLKFLPRLSHQKSISSRFVGRVQRALYRHGWVDEEFNWTCWMEAEQFVGDPARIADADVVTIRKLLTTHVRKERFSEGHFCQMIASGHLLALLNRLKAINYAPAYSLT